MARTELIQVCADPSSPETRTHELRALIGASKHDPRAAKRLLVLDHGTLLPGDVPGVEVQPTYEWLLAAPVEAQAQAP